MQLIADETPINFNVGHSFSPTTISIGNLWSAVAPSLTLAGTINNPIGTTMITVSGGALVAQSKALIRSATVELSAAGAIGSSAQPLHVEEVASVGVPQTLTAAAGGSMALEIGADLREAGRTQTVTIGSLTAGGTIDLTLDQAVVETTPVGPSYAVAVTTTLPSEAISTTTIVRNHFHFDTSPAPALPLGIFGTGTATVPTTYLFDLLTAGGAVSMFTKGTSVGIIATTDLAGTSPFKITATGDVSITELTGDLTVGTVQGGAASTVTLQALNGSIEDIPPGTVSSNEPAHISAGNIVLSAANGSIGATANPLNIALLAVPGALPGALTASAQGTIAITESTGNLGLAQVVSTSGDVSLSAAKGSILDATGRTMINVTGKTVSLTATFGSIGSAGDHLAASATTGLGGISATATNGVFLDKSVAPTLQPHSLASTAASWLFDDGSGSFIAPPSAQQGGGALNEAGTEWLVDGLTPAKVVVDWSGVAA